VGDVSPIRVEPASPAAWADLVDLFTRGGPRGGTPQTDGCWCQFWRLRGRAYWNGHDAANRNALEGELASGSEPGLIASVDGVAAGWCRVGPRESYPRLESSRKLARVDDEDAWAAVCFFVDPALRKSGVASALLNAATERAAVHGAAVLEGYPVAPGHPTIDAYTGYLPMFLDAGFESVRDAGRRTFVRRRL
jgi:GNAT superfamily N-acetyltransferase